MKVVLTIITITVILYLACNPGEGGNHPVNPPGGDTTRTDTTKKDTVLYKPLP